MYKLKLPSYNIKWLFSATSRGKEVMDSILSVMLVWKGPSYVSILIPLSAKHLT